MNLNQHSADSLFRDELIHVQANFMESDWIAMEKLLDQKTPMFFWPLFTNFKNILIITIMITTAILAISFLTNTSSFSEHASPIQSLDIYQHSGIESTTENVESFHFVQFSQALNSIRVDNDGNEATLFNKPILASIVDIADSSDKSENIAVNDSVEVQDTAQFYKKVVSRYWVEDSYRYIYHKPKYDMEDAWLGFHYTQQANNDAALWDSIGRHQQTHGFNLQIMSGNLLKGEHLAIYGGLDWGMQFYGRSGTDEVILNTNAGDKGLSYIRSHTNDLAVRAHLEYARARLVPYASAGFGTRIFSNGQTIKGLLESTEFESETSHALLTSATQLATFGAGLRVHISPRVSLDMRYEIQQTGNADVIDYGESTFNGLQYDVSKANMDLSSGQFKWGLVFDISSNDREKVLEKEGHYEETVQELYLDKSDSEKIYIPCPCNPCDDEDDDMDDNRHGRIFFPIDVLDGGGSSPRGGGKSKFPGVKSPPVRH